MQRTILLIFIFISIALVSCNRSAPQPLVQEPQTDTLPSATTVITPQADPKTETKSPKKYLVPEAILPDTFEMPDPRPPYMPYVGEPIEDPAPIELPKVYEPNPNDYIAVDKEAVVLNYEEVKKQIGYPEIAKEINLEGKVVIRILVDETGKYVKSIVLKDPHPILTKSVTKYAPMLKFEPAMLNGQPIKYWVTQVFSFRLN